MASFRRLQILQSPNSLIKLTALFLCPSKISGGCPLIDPLEYGTGPACPPLPGLQLADQVHWGDPSWRTSRRASSWRASHNCASARESWSVRATSPSPCASSAHASASSNAACRRSCYACTNRRPSSEYRGVTCSSTGGCAPSSVSSEYERVGRS